MIGFVGFSVYSFLGFEGVCFFKFNNFLWIMFEIWLLLVFFNLFINVLNVDRWNRVLELLFFCLVFWNDFRFIEELRRWYREFSFIFYLEFYNVNVFYVGILIKIDVVIKWYRYLNWEILVFCYGLNGRFLYFIRFSFYVFFLFWDLFWEIVFIYLLWFSYYVFLVIFNFW